MAEFPAQLSCFKCGKLLDNFSPGDGVQPIGGLSLETGGHYGSSFFDPVGDSATGSHLCVVACDECLDEVERNRPEDAPAVVRSRMKTRARATYERVSRRELERDWMSLDAVVAEIEKIER